MALTQVIGSGIGSIGATTVTGEGTATTSLQQGLAKLWHQTNASSGTPSTQDSFNMGSITDNGVGNFTFAFTNNMGNNDYSWTHTGVTDGTYSLYHGASLSVGTSWFVSKLMYGVLLARRGPLHAASRPVYRG